MCVPDQRRAVGGPVLPAEPGRDESLPYGLREKRGGVRGDAGGDDREGEGGEEGEPYSLREIRFSDEKQKMKGKIRGRGISAIVSTASVYLRISSDKLRMAQKNRPVMRLG